MRWKLAEKIPSEIRKNFKGYSDIVAQLLYNRGIQKVENAEIFLFRKQTKLHDPELLPNVKKAAEFILETIKNKEKILIYGDYDVDGVSASSLLFDFLFRELKAQVVPYIPNRFEEGYGLSKAGLDSALKENIALVITVDCGIRDKDLVSEYATKGLSFIITDHHALAKDPGGKPLLPDKAEAIVHPGLPNSKYPFNMICGTTVAWKLVQVLAKKANSRKMLSEKINVNKYLDLVALATVCDCMDLIDENRLLVKMGLEVMRSTKNLGLSELFNVAHINPVELDTYHLGFILGPRLNAAGRVEHALAGVRLLTSKDQIKLQLLAENLIRKINRGVLPGLQGGPFNNNIAGICVGLGEALKPEFKKYAREIVKNSRTLAEELKKYGFDLVSGGTDKHLILIDMTNKGIFGKYTAKALDEAGIVLNMNTMPGETRPPADPSAIRMGTPLLTTRGMGKPEMRQIAKWIDEVVTEIRPWAQEEFSHFMKKVQKSQVINRVRKEVTALCHKFPLMI